VWITSRTHSLLQPTSGGVFHRATVHCPRCLIVTSTDHATSASPSLTQICGVVQRSLGRPTAAPSRLLTSPRHVAAGEKPAAASHPAPTMHHSCHHIVRRVARISLFPEENTSLSLIHRLTADSCVTAQGRWAVISPGLREHCTADVGHLGHFGCCLLGQANGTRPWIELSPTQCSVFKSFFICFKYLN
jgi:hypothetical protein